MRSLSLILVAAATAHASYIADVPVQTRDIPPLPTLFKRQKFEAPCAEVAASWSALKPKATGSVFVPAKVAYDCLQSVPVDKDGDLKLIEEMKDFMQFQSDLTYLKDGIKTHNAEPLDIIGELDNIANAIKNGSIKGEYEVQQRIRLMLNKAGDYHLHWTADIQTPLRFTRANAELLSISKDGLELPEVYSLYDIKAQQDKNASISAIKSINGKEVQEFLNEAALQNPFHDQDARYNRLFPNIPQRSMGEQFDDPAAFVNPLTYPGETTEIEYKNGTKQTIQNVAEIQSWFSFANVKDGDSFFQQFCTGSISKTFSTSDARPTGVAKGGKNVDDDAGPAEKAKADDEVDEDVEQGGYHTKDHYDENRKHWRRDVSENDKKYIQDAVEKANKGKGRPGKPKPVDGPNDGPDDDKDDAPPTTSAAPVSSTLPSAAPSSSVAAVKMAIPSDYPVPIITQSGLALQGYYMKDAGYDDIAVLVMPSFGPSIDARFTDEIFPQREWQTVLKTFLAGAAKDQKKRLIVDVRGNTGGLIDVGYETFKQIFPDMDPFGATRYRASEAFGVFSAAIADFTDNATFAKADPNLHSQLQAEEYTWDYKNIMNENGENYVSYNEYWGPYTINKDRFTALRRYNYTNLKSGYTSAGTFNLTGYGDQAPAPKRIFQAENIIILQDGLCGSTCAIFSQMMREQGNVHAIGVGGRPVEAPMQGVGGTKGAQVFTFDAMQDNLELALNATEVVYGSATADAVRKTSVGRLIAASQLTRRSSHTGTSQGLPTFLRYNSLNNFRNKKVRKDLSEDELNTPLEFVYEATDCRLFNTLETLKSPIAMWKMASDTKWAKGKCAKGSANDPSAVGSVFQVPFNKEVNGNPPKSNGDSPPGAKNSPDGKKDEKKDDKKEGAASGLRVSGLMVVVAVISVVAAMM